MSDWTEEEHVPVLAAVWAKGWKGLTQREAEPIAAELGRSWAAVKRKSSDITSSAPDWKGVVTRGGGLTATVTMEFLAEARGLDIPPAPILELPEWAREGDVRVVRHVRYERNRKLRQAKLDQNRSQFGCICCEVCRFDARSLYGTMNDVIDVHHIEPLSLTGPRNCTLGDLVVLCPNCHRTVHHGFDRMLTPDELRDLL